MSSIPGLPTPGSEVPVLINKVNLKSSHGLVELWVSMDDGRNHIYEQKREEIQIPQKKFYGSEGKPGDTCLVCVTDAWHRAQIVSIQNETYNVFLIDKGEPHVTTSGALAWGKNDSFLFPPKIELCILANVISLQNEWPETVTKFLMCLPGKRFKGLVRYIIKPDRIILLEIPIISKHMCKLGAAKKIKVDEFLEVVQRHLCESGKSSGSLCLPQELELDVRCQLPHHDQYFYPELMTDIFETVNVTAVFDPLNISCMLFVFYKAVKLLSDQIHQHYEESSDFREAHPQSCGDPCATRGADGRWHRSLLKQNMVTGEDVVEVFHVDEGKPELVKAEGIRPLLGRFLKMPVFTYHCSLSGVKASLRKWTADETDEVKSMLLDKTLVARIDDHDKPQDVYYVSLYGANAECINGVFLEKAGLVSSSESGKDLNDQKESSSFLSLEEKKLLNLHYQTNGVCDLEEKTRPNATDQVDSARSGCSQVPGTPLHNNGDLSTSLLQNACDDGMFAVGETVDVQISCIESLQKFWCQPLKSGDSLKGLMQNLQIFYASANPQSVVESIYVARNPENQMWYRAKIIANHNSSTVDVRFIDYGQTQKVPVQDVHPIDPAFLKLSAQALPCCLFNLNDDSIPNTWTNAALTEFQKFVDLSVSSNTGLKCVVKAITCDDSGLPLNVVDIQMESESLCKLLTQKCAQSQEQIPPDVPVNRYSYSTNDVEVDGKENVFVTSSETVSNLYCQLQRNSHVNDKLIKNIAKLLDQSKISEHPLELNSVCLAKYTDGQWYRGQIVEVSPKLKVQFVDYGNTLTVLETDIIPFPSDSNLVRSVPVQAIPLGLFDMPADVPQEVNQWFSNLVDGRSFIISVIAKEENGKLTVEMFDGSLNLNTMVREKAKDIKQTKMTCTTRHSDQQLSNDSNDDLPNEECPLQDERESLLQTTEQKESHSYNMHIVSSPQMEEVMILDKTIPNLDCENKEALIQSSKINSEFPPLSTGSCQEQNGITYKWPSITRNTTAEVYASCIVTPEYFWCQYAKTEDLNTIAKLAKEAGHTQKDEIFDQTLKPGSPCLALFSQDDQWYRAQVVQKQEETLLVLFVDYGNEAEVDIKNVRPLPKILLDSTPQAFLCCLSGFDESEGSWNDTAYDEFYNLLFNMPLKVTVFSKKDHPDIAVPQFSVELEQEGVDINTGMLKYWKPVAESCAKVENFQTVDAIQGGEDQPNPVDLSVYKKAFKNIDLLTDPKKSNGKTEMVYASCIAEPSFFWCQFSNTDDLIEVSKLAHEAGQEKQDAMIPKSLNIGDPCLALFSQDNQWYRAQILQKDEETLRVLFVDYGNEAEVDVRNVRPLPQSLLETTPQAFLCSLSGFDESKGCWTDEAYDDFYNVLINKPLKLTIHSMMDHPEITVPQYSVDVDHEGVNINALMLKYWKPITEDMAKTENPSTTDSIQGDQEQRSMKQRGSKDASNKMDLKDLMISRKITESVYASCISEPDFFWCQFSNTDDLHKVSQLAQEFGQEDQDVMFPQSLESGSPCLALFSQDGQWYRAQVIQKDGETLHVLFVDYGNEAEVDIKNVRALPKSLLETSPQAFLCRLSGFEKSKGSWDDAAYDEFYKLLVDKLLKVTVLNMEEHSEIEIPQYEVQMECEGVVVNTLMKKYWRPLDVEGSLASLSGSSGPR